MESKLDIFPSNRLVERLFKNLPIKYYAFYTKVESDLCYNLDDTLPNLGLNLLEYKLTDKELITNYPMEWLEQYFNYELVDQDPVLQYGRHTLMSFTWGDISTKLPKLANQNLDNVMKYSRRFDINNGLSVPIVIGNQTYGVFTVVLNNNSNLSDLHLYAIASLCQNLGTYLVSYEHPTPLKPLDQKTVVKLTQSYKALEQISALISESIAE